MFEAAVAEPVPEQRVTWGRHIEFVITCVGYAVGLGNVWRFPYLCFSNGGGAFLIPYFTCLFAIGLPTFFLEISFGQFVGTGTISAWEINPLFKGLGYSMVMVSVIIGIYYPTIIACALYFLFASMQSTLPWSSCDNNWNTCYCREDHYPKENWTNGNGKSCLNLTLNGETQKSASHEYYFNEVLALTPGIADLGGMKWDLTACNLLVWSFILFSVMYGIKSMGKVVYVSAILPYFLMTALLIKGLSLPGAGKGIAFYMDFNFSKILSAEVWRAAGSQIFFSLSCCMGGLIAMSSYNKFNTNTVRDTFMIAFINCGTSLYAGFAVFATLGYMSETSGKSVQEVAVAGPSLVFVAYPTALAKMPFAQIWCIFFFLMMALLGIGTQMPIVETVGTALQDEFPFLRKGNNNIMFRCILCVMGFLLGLPHTTRGGLWVLNLFDTFIQLPLLLVGLSEIIAIVWVYGIANFSEDIMLMVGYSTINERIFHYYFKFALLLMTPLFIAWITLYNIIDYQPISASDAYPYWSEVLGWILFFLVMGWTPVWYLIRYCRFGGYELLKEMNKPTSKWGPGDPEQRTIPRYRPPTPVQEQPMFVLPEILVVGNSGTTIDAPTYASPQSIIAPSVVEPDVVLPAPPSVPPSVIASP